MQLAELVNRLEELWPSSGAEVWDNPGLALGAPDLEVRKVLLAVDVTPAVVAEAIDNDADLILSHHPILFRSLSSLATEDSTVTTLLSALHGKVALFSAHTNADHVSGGVSESLADYLGLIDLAPLDAQSGHGRVGRLLTPLPLREFAELIRRLLPRAVRGVAIQGDPERMVSTVAVLAGAGDSFLQQVGKTTCDAYVTSDLRHHHALDFAVVNLQREQPIALLDISHFEAEAVWISGQVQRLGKVFPELDFIESTINTDPWDFQII